MKTITFLRHAEPSSLGEITLNGIMQTKSRILDLPVKNFDLLITSDTLRTYQTGIHIFEELKLERPYIKLKELNIPKEAHPKSYYNLAKKALLEIIKFYHAENILVISHSGVLNELGFLFSDNNPIFKTTFFGCTEGFLIDFNTDPKSIVIIK
jgi:broad specificity phosphatase PhoE